MRLIVAITGSSGAIYGIRLLEALRAAPKVEVHLILSKGGKLTAALETGRKAKDIEKLAHHVHSDQDLAASVASGSFRTAGMIVAPCSMKTLAEIATGNASSLLSRAADVMLKERRRLVLMVRETPLSLVHLRNMVSVTEMGAIIAPPVPAFYARPQNLDQMIEHTLGRVLDLFDIDSPAVRRWEGTASRANA